MSFDGRNVKYLLKTHYMLHMQHIVCMFTMLNLIK